MKSVIILDTYAAQRDRVRAQINAAGFSALCFGQEASLLDNFRSLAPDLLIIGKAPLRTQSRVIHSIKSFDFRFPILFIHANDSASHLIDSNGYEKVESLINPYTQKELIQKLTGLLDASPSGENGIPPLPIVGKSLEIQKIRKQIQAIASSMAPVFIIGETGTGKDHVAQSIHWNTIKNQGLTIKYDVPAIFNSNDRPSPDELPNQIKALIQKLPHEAPLSKPQKRLTILIDAIDQLPLDHQSSLFEFLTHEGEKQIGAHRDYAFQPRILCTSRREVSDLVKKGLFRKDLYLLLSLFTIEIPPLRQRTDDIIALVDYFTAYYSLGLSKTCFDISEDAVAMLQSYNWPCNVGELKMLMENVVKSGSEAILFDHISTPAHIFSGVDETGNTFKKGCDLQKHPNHLDIETAALPLKLACKRTVIYTEKKLISKALNRTNWNRRRAADLLEISYRSLLNKIKAYDISC